jgi:hypothetical protein
VRYFKIDLGEDIAIASCSDNEEADKFLEKCKDEDWDIEEINASEAKKFKQ